MDIRKKCIQCGEQFVITEEEQKNYKNKGYSFPKRCKSCRKDRRDEDKFLEDEMIHLVVEKELERRRVSTQLVKHKHFDKPLQHRVKNLFIIGNGFDIWCGLNTRYSDFEEFYERNKISISWDLGIEPCEMMDREGNLVENLTQFDLLYFVLSENSPTMLDDNTDFWSDYENSLVELDDVAINMHFGKEIEDLKDIRIDCDYAYEIIRKSFSEWIKSIDSNCNSIKDQFRFNDSLFVNFNYTDIPVKDVFGLIFGQDVPDMSERVIVYLRLPRTLCAILVGIALSVSGAVYQSAFNNKLVSPDLLGVSSGASVGACFAILLGMSAILISLFSFIAGFIAVALTLLIAKAFKNKSNVILLLSGIAVGGLMSSCVGLMKYLADNEMKLAEMTYWLLGDLSNTTIKDFYIFLPIVVVFSTLTLVFSWRINIVSLGAKEAKSLGVNYNLMMILLIVSATALTAGAVAVSGTIGWIGLVVPNIVRLIVGSDNKKVIPVSMLVGACFMVIVDMLARSLAPNEIPLSVITGIIGTPVFIYAIFKRRKELR